MKYNTAILVTLASLFLVVEANSDDTTIINSNAVGNQLRRRNIDIKLLQPRKVYKICKSVGLTAYTDTPTYQTVNSTSLFSMGLLYVTRQFYKGDCQSELVCQNACKSFSYHTIHTSNATCVCSNTAPIVSESLDGNVSTLNEEPPIILVILPPAPMPLSTMAPTSVPVPVPVSTPTVKTVFCANPYGNPCGPMSACTDTDTGITCTPIDVVSCPLGCGPNSSCQKISTGYQCVCNTGFARPESYLPCMESP